jgi:hypothetical protein
MLPQWRPLFEAMSKLSKLKSSEIDTLVKLAKAVTEKDDEGESFLNNDGTLNFGEDGVIETSTLSLSVFDTETAVQETNFALSSGDGVLLSNEGRFSSPYRALQHVGGVHTAINAAHSELEEVLEDDAAFAAPIWFDVETTITEISAFATNDVNVDGGIRSGGLYTDANGKPGKSVVLATGIVGGFDSGEPMVPMGSVKVERGLYWIVLAVTSMFGNNGGGYVPKFTMNTNAANHLGMIPGIPMVPIGGLVRSGAAGLLSADESGGAWTPTPGTIFPILYAR